MEVKAKCPVACIPYLARLGPDIGVSVNISPIYESVVYTVELITGSRCLRPSCLYDSLVEALESVAEDNDEVLADRVIRALLGDSAADRLDKVNKLSLATSILSSLAVYANLISHGVMEEVAYAALPLALNVNVVLSGDMEALEKLAERLEKDEKAPDYVKKLARTIRMEKFYRLENSPVESKS